MSSNDNPTDDEQSYQPLNPTELRILSRTVDDLENRGFAVTEVGLDHHTAGGITGAMSTVVGGSPMKTPEYHLKLMAPEEMPDEAYVDVDLTELDEVDDILAAIGERYENELYDDDLDSIEWARERVEAALHGGDGE